MAEELSIYHEHDEFGHSHPKPGKNHGRGIDLGNGTIMTTDGTPPLVKRPKPLRLVASWATTQFTNKKRDEIGKKVARIKKEEEAKKAPKKEKKSHRVRDALFIFGALSLLCSGVTCFGGIKAVEEVRRVGENVQKYFQENLPDIPVIPNIK